jgi:hypothetical protein
MQKDSESDDLLLYLVLFTDLSKNAKVSEAFANVCALTMIQSKSDWNDSMK